MKFVTLFALFLFVGVSYQACCESCISKLTTDSDFQSTDEWSLPSVTTYNIASTSSADVNEDGFCGNIFKEYGSCCNQTELYERACAWNNRLTYRMKRILKGLDLMSNYTKSIGKFIDTIEGNSESITGSGGNTTLTDPPRKPFSPFQTVFKLIVIEGKPKAGTNMCGNSLSFANLSKSNIGKGKPKLNLTKPDFVSPWVDRLEYIKNDPKTERQAREKSAIEKSADCQKALTKLRTNALCMRCSGVASFFYSKSGYSVSESTCSYIIENCAVVFAAISEANSLYTTLANLKSSLGGKTAPHAYGKVATNEEIEKWTDCADDIDLCLQNGFKKSQLCSQVSLSSDNQAFEGNVNSFAEGKGAGDAIIAGLSAKEGIPDYATFSLSRRLLQTKSAVLTDADDNYGYMIPSSSGPDLVNYFSYSNIRDSTAKKLIKGIVYSIILIAFVI